MIIATIDITTFLLALVERHYQWQILKYLFFSRDTGKPSDESEPELCIWNVLIHMLRSDNVHRLCSIFNSQAQGASLVNRVQKPHAAL